MGVCSVSLSDTGNSHMAKLNVIPHHNKGSPFFLVLAELAFLDLFLCAAKMSFRLDDKPVSALFNLVRRLSSRSTSCKMQKLARFRKPKRIKNNRPLTHPPVSFDAQSLEVAEASYGYFFDA